MKTGALRSFRHYRRMPLISPRLWMRRIAFWLGALLVALVAMAFANLADHAQGLFTRAITWNRWSVLVIAPAGLAFAVFLTRGIFPGSQGSGIPQVIASLHMSDNALISRVLSPRIAVGKVLLTLFGLMSGASIGREGPTVQVGATIMHSLGKFLRLPRVEAQRGLVLAGGAAGVAAAFNTPLAGVVFAIEELSHSFESRTSGVVMTAVIVAGITSLALVGNYTYFGVAAVELDWGRGWFAVLLCAVIGGAAGGLFSRILIVAARGFPGRVGSWVLRHPIGFAVFCGLALAVIGLVSGGSTYGTGYEQAKLLVEGDARLPASYFVLKLVATTLSYLTGIPGGIFAPSLSVGAAMGGWLATFVPGATSGAVVLLGMVAYFSGVVQAPITAFVIVLEMTSNQQMTVPLMATSLLAYGVSRMVCRRALYGALAQRFLQLVEPPRAVALEE